MRSYSSALLMCALRRNSSDGSNLRCSWRMESMLVLGAGTVALSAIQKPSDSDCFAEVHFTARRETLSAKTLQKLLTAEIAEKIQSSQRKPNSWSRPICCATPPIKNRRVSFRPLRRSRRSLRLKAFELRSKHTVCTKAYWRIAARWIRRSGTLPRWRSGLARYSHHSRNHKNDRDERARQIAAAIQQQNLRRSRSQESGELHTIPLELRDERKISEPRAGGRARPDWLVPAA